jgi:hypothetical protein
LSPRRTRFVSYIFADEPAPLARRYRTIDQRLKRRLRSSVRISCSKEPMGRVMTQIDSAELPHELVHIEILPEMSQVDGALNKFGQREAPLTFHLEDLVPHVALDVVELEQTGRYRTSSRQPRALGPSEPIANESL